MHILTKLPRTLSKRSVSETLAAIIVFIFLYTAVSKLVEVESFIEVLGKSPLLSPYKNLVAWSIPIAEIVLVVLLTIPKTRRTGFAGSFAILAAFTLYLAYMIIFTPNLPCTCGGVVSNLTWTQHIIFNCVLIGLSLLGLRLTKRQDL